MFYFNIFKNRMNCYDDEAELIYTHTHIYIYNVLHFNVFELNQ